MPTVLAYLSPAAERQQGEQGVVLALSRSPTGFRLRAACGENGRVIGRWVGDCPRTVIEMGLGWLTSYGWNIGQASDSPLDVNEAMNLPELQSTNGHVQDIIDALQANFPPKDPTVPETGARVQLARRKDPAPVVMEEPESVDPERVERLLARARQKIARGADPERIAKKVAELLSTTLAEAWYMLNPPGIREDEEEDENEDEEEEAEEVPPPREHRRHARVPDAPTQPARSATRTPSSRPHVSERLRPLGRDEIPQELTEEQAAFLRATGANPGDYEKMQRTHRRAQQMHEIAEATLRRNAKIDAALARRREREADEQADEVPQRRAPARRGAEADETEPRRRRTRREEEEAAAMLAAAQAELADLDEDADDVDEDYEDEEGLDEDTDDVDEDGEDGELDEGDNEDEDEDGEDEDGEGDVLDEDEDDDLDDDESGEDDDEGEEDDGESDDENDDGGEDVQPVEAEPPPPPPVRRRRARDQAVTVQEAPVQGSMGPIRPTGVVEAPEATHDTKPPARGRGQQPRARK